MSKEFDLDLPAACADRQKLKKLNLPWFLNNDSCPLCGLIISKHDNFKCTTFYTDKQYHEVFFKCFCDKLTSKIIKGYYRRCEAADVSILFHKENVLQCAFVGGENLKISIHSGQYADSSRIVVNYKTMKPPPLIKNLNDLKREVTRAIKASDIFDTFE
jgi:hypothetical protein